MKLIQPLLLFWFFFSATLGAQDIKVWPGDVNNNGIVNEVDLLFLGLGYGQMGPERKSVSSTWEAQNITNAWATSAVEGLDLVYADCNGNGVINASDVNVIKQNFGLTHSDVDFVPDVIPVGIPGVSPSFSFPADAGIAITPNTQKIEIPINLGDSANIVENLIGLSFYIKANPKAFNVNATTFKFEGWLPSENAVTIEQPISTGRSAPGDFVVAYTKTNQLPETGNGLIGIVSLSPSFIVIDNVPDFKITIDSIVLIDNTNTKTPVLGSEIVLDVVGFKDSTMLTTSICQGESVQFNNLTISTAGTYRDTLVNQYGRDSMLILEVEVADTTQTMRSVIICQGDFYAFANQNLMQVGTYRDTLQNFNGCDSVVVLSLAVADTTQSTMTATIICQGDFYTFANQDLMQAGTYRDTLQNFNGCDSVVVLSLAVENTAQSTMTATTICQGDFYAFANQNLMQAGTYQDTLQNFNGCDSVVVLSLAVEDTLQTILDRNICQGDSFLFNGQSLTIAGTYRDTLTAFNGCQQYVVLNLAVGDTLQTALERQVCAGDSFIFNELTLTETGVYRDTLQALNGCDQYIVLSLKVAEAIETSISSTICAGESYLFGNQPVNANGLYERTVTSSTGCDSTIYLDLTVLPKAEATYVQQICDGESVNFNGLNLSATGTYYDTLTALNGCDSLTAITLIVINSDETVIKQTICENASYAFNGRNLTNEGIYRDTFSNLNSCDSIIILNLSISDRYETTLNHSICAGESMNFNGRSLTTTGTYRDTFLAINGCDSLTTLNLTINPVANSVLNEEICHGGSINFNGRTIEAAGTYLDTLRSFTGCDSIIELNLAVAPILESSSNHTICAGETMEFFNFVLTATNSYMVILQTANGCDSMVILNLLVLEEEITTVDQTICADEIYLFGNDTLTTAGTYTQSFSSAMNCDSTVQLNLSVLTAKIITIDTSICPDGSMLFGNEELTEAGTYTQSLTGSNTCDSMVVLNLTIWEAGVGECMSVGIEEELLEGIEIYPNPVRQSLIINSPSVKMRSIRLINITGQTLINQSFNIGSESQQSIINMQDMLPGVYWVLIQTEHGMRQEKIVKF